METFLATYWPEILLSLVTAGSIAFSKYLFNQMKNYKNLLEKQDEHEIVTLVKKELEPFAKQNEKLNKELIKSTETHNLQLEAMVRFFRFCLIQMCKAFLDQKYITTQQFEQLSEFYKLYKDLGGNGQGKEYYEKAMGLPVKDDITISSDKK